MSWQAGSRSWQQDRHQGRRTVWSPLRLTQNPAGFCRQWMHSWMVCGSRRGVVIVRRREFVVVGAGLFWPAARARQHYALPSAGEVPWRERCANTVIS